MKLFTVLILLVFSMPCAALDGCYTANINVGGNKNTMIMCSTGKNTVSIKMRFSNNLNSSPPTVCNQVAKIENIESGFNVQGSPGKCENGMKQPPYVFPCKYTGKDGFNCSPVNITETFVFTKN